MRTPSSARLTPMQNAASISAMGALIMFIGFTLPWNAPTPCYTGHWCLGYAADGWQYLIGIIIGIFTELPYLLTHIAVLTAQFGWLQLLGVLLIFACGVAIIMQSMKAPQADRFLRLNVAQMATALVGLVAIMPIAAMIISYTVFYPNALDELGFGIYVMALGFLMAFVGSIYARIVWQKNLR
jgi:hypothetical protein